MKIITIVRTLNEESNIKRFCESYLWVDKLIIADGGSTDKTIEIASTYKNVEIYNFLDIIKTGNFISNPRGKHINFLIDLAKKNNPDWIIFDDCDCVPTVTLQKEGRAILESCSESLVHAYRLYIYGYDKYAPELNIPGQSLWAWKSNVDVQAIENNPLWFEMHIPKESVLNLDYPHSLLHYCWPSEEVIQMKRSYYGETGEMPKDSVHPFQLYRFINLPDWAKCNE